MARLYLFLRRQYFLRTHLLGLFTRVEMHPPACDDQSSIAPTSQKPTRTCGRRSRRRALMLCGRPRCSAGKRVGSLHLLHVRAFEAQYEIAVFVGSLPACRRASVRLVRRRARLRLLRDALGLPRLLLLENPRGWDRLGRHRLSGRENNTGAFKLNARRSSRVASAWRRKR